MCNYPCYLKYSLCACPRPPGVFRCCRAHLAPPETECNIHRYDRRADCHPTASDAENWNQQHRRAGELTGIELGINITWCVTWNNRKQHTVLQMGALQRIHVFRLFDVFSLLDCLHGLCSNGLQQVHFQFILFLFCFFSLLCLKYTNNLFVLGTFWEDFLQSNFVMFCVRHLLAGALLRQWLWTRCQLLSSLYWEANKVKVICLCVSSLYVRLQTPVIKPCRKKGVGLPPI